MKLIRVRKILRYDPTGGGKYNRYDRYSLTLAGAADPEVIPGQTPMGAAGTGRVFCSPAKRARESVVGQPEIRKELREVIVNLPGLVGRSEYEKHGSDLVRQRFVRAFIADSVGERRRQIKKRMEKIIRLADELLDGEYLLISHSFTMKILETYLEHRDLFEKPEILADYLIPGRKTYNFGEGFDFEI